MLILLLLLNYSVFVGPMGLAIDFYIIAPSTTFVMVFNFITKLVV